MIAAAIDPREVAEVFEHLAAECHRAAPPRKDRKPSSDIARLQSPPKFTEDRADRLIHSLSLLGEHVGGTWSWVPGRNPVNPDGVIDDAVPWETEVASPPSELLEVIGSRGAIMDRASADVTLQDEHPLIARAIHEKVRRLARSAVEELWTRFSGRTADAVLRNADASLREHGEDLARIHADFLKVIDDVRRAVQDVDSPRTGWSREYDRLMRVFTAWIDAVPAHLPMDRVKRQAFKRDMSVAVAQVTQHVHLLRGNAELLLLLRLVAFVKSASQELRITLAKVQPGIDRSPQVGRSVRMKFDRTLVSKTVEERWRKALGTKARGVGRLIQSIVGAKGQAKPIQRSVLLKSFVRAKLVTAKSEKSRADAVDALLVQMQLAGLAVKIPAAAFRDGKGRSPRTGPRKRAHVGRAWLFNPLGAVLARPGR
jgi:hypothetical protein